VYVIEVQMNKKTDSWAKVLDMESYSNNPNVIKARVFDTEALAETTAQRLKGVKNKVYRIVEVENDDA